MAQLFNRKEKGEARVRRRRQICFLVPEAKKPEPINPSFIPRRKKAKERKNYPQNNRTDVISQDSFPSEHWILRERHHHGVEVCRCAITHWTMKTLMGSRRINRKRLFLSFETRMSRSRKWRWMLCLATYLSGKFHPSLAANDVLFFAPIIRARRTKNFNVIVIVRPNSHHQAQAQHFSVCRWTKRKTSHFIEPVGEGKRERETLFLS